MNERSPITADHGATERLMDITEFRRRGYLQEVNRRLLHPLGMELVVSEPDELTGVQKLLGVLDYRDHPQGVAYASLDVDKAGAVGAEMHNRAIVRARDLGYIVQPLPNPPSRPPSRPTKATKPGAWLEPVAWLGNDPPDPSEEQ